MDNWQEEIGLLEAKDHITFLQDSLSTLSSMSAELTEQIDRLKVQLATAQDERDAALYAKVQTEEVVEAQRAEMTARTAAFQVQFVTLQDSLDAALNSRAQLELEATNLRADLAKVRAQSEKAMAERASEIESSLAALRSAERLLTRCRLTWRPLLHAVLSRTACCSNRNEQATSSFKTASSSSLPCAAS